DIEADLHLTGELVGHGLRRVAVWHVNDVDTGHHLEQLAREKNRASGRRTKVQLSRIGIGVGDELRDCLDRQRWIDRNKVRNADGAGNRRDVADEIELKIVEERRTDRVSCNDIEQRVAIWDCAYGGLGADIAACAGSILDDEWLSEPF